MKVGMIGLGRMGEGMSRRLIAAGHEVHGFRNNVQKAEAQYEAGYISGYTTSIQSLVQVVHSGRNILTCLLYTSPSPRDLSTSRMPSSA